MVVVYYSTFEQAIMNHGWIHNSNIKIEYEEDTITRSIAR